MLLCEASTRSSKEAVGSPSGPQCQKTGGHRQTRGSGPEDGPEDRMDQESEHGTRGGHVDCPAPGEPKDQSHTRTEPHLHRNEPDSGKR